MSIINFENKIVLVTTILVGILLVLSVFGGMISSLTDSSNTLQHPNNCSSGTDSAGISLNYNLSSGYCYNSTGNSLYLAQEYGLPLSSVITGIVLIFLFIGIFVLLVISIIRYLRK